MKTKKELLTPLDFDFILDLNVQLELLKSIRYFTKEDFVEGLVRRLTREECQFLYFAFSENLSLEKTIRIFLTQYRPNSSFLVKQFVDNYLRKEISESDDDIIFFEFPVMNKRTDICRINHFSYTYEIKSRIDNVYRSIEQTEIFLKVFEYVFLVIDNNGIPKGLNEHVGIIRSVNMEKAIEFELIRDPIKSDSLNPQTQLNLIQKKELSSYLGCRNKNKQESIRTLFDSNSKEEINSRFKHIIKERYRSQSNPLERISYSKNR